MTPPSNNTLAHRVVRLEVTVETLREQVDRDRREMREWLRDEFEELKENAEQREMRMLSAFDEHRNANVATLADMRRVVADIAGPEARSAAVRAAMPVVALFGVLLTTIATAVIYMVKAGVPVSVMFGGP